MENLFEKANNANNFKGIHSDDDDWGDFSIAQNCSVESGAETEDSGTPRDICTDLAGQHKPDSFSESTRSFFDRASEIFKNNVDFDGDLEMFSSDDYIQQDCIDNLTRLSSDLSYSYELNEWGREQIVNSVFTVFDAGPSDEEELETEISCVSNILCRRLQSKPFRKSHSSFDIKGNNQLDTKQQQEFSSVSVKNQNIGGTIISAVCISEGNFQSKVDESDVESHMRPSASYRANTIFRLGSTGTESLLLDKSSDKASSPRESKLLTAGEKLEFLKHIPDLSFVLNDQIDFL